MESASDSDEDKEGEERGAVGDVEPAPAVLPAYLDQPACVTRGQAGELGISVPDVDLPDQCWSSSRYQH